MGINVNRMITLTFALSAMLASVAGFCSVRSGFWIRMWA